mgnify:CR=1 FL=1
MPRISASKPSVEVIVQISSTASISAAAGAADDYRPSGAWHAEWPALRQLLRLAGGARLDAVMTGVSASEHESSLILPPAPRAATDDAHALWLKSQSGVAPLRPKKR